MKSVVTRGWVIFVAMMLSAACATTPPPVANAPAAGHVVLEREANGETWRATWHLAQPARELRFERDTTAFRGEIFEVLTPGYSMARDGDHEVLRTDGEPSRTIAVRFPEDARTLGKDYVFFVRFTDGSVAIYTGHLLARAVRAGEENDCRSCIVNTFRLLPGEDESVIAGGKRARTALDWSDESYQGSYVYFGSIEPVESDAIISIMDPGFPPWMRAASERTIPSLFALFSRKLAVELPVRPMVLTSFTRSDMTGYSFKGGVVPGAVQLTAEGSAWETESEEGLLRYLRLLAHETVHLWNGGVVEYPDMEHSWLHEGSADALAERALLELGVIDERRFLEFQTAAINDCRRGLGAAPLTGAAKRGAFSLYYSCGNAIALLTETSLRGGEPADLFDFWRGLIEKTIATEGRTYGPSDYIAHWRDMGASDGDAAVLRDLVEKPADPAMLVSALRDRGVDMEPMPNPPEDHGQTLAKEALLHLMKQNCRGRFGFRTTARGLALADTLDCDTIPAGAVVRAIDGHDVLRTGHLAAEAVHRACGSSSEVKLRFAPLDETDARPEAPARCEAAFPAPLPYLSVTGRSGRHGQRHRRAGTEGEPDEQPDDQHR